LPLTNLQAGRHYRYHTGENNQAYCWNQWKTRL